MSDKEQQIEEIEQFIYDYVDSKQTEKVYLCSSHVNELAKPFVHNKGIAEALYNAGYRKVPNGAVILTPEERDEELKACNEKQAELEAEIEILKIQNNNLEIAFDRLNARSERLETDNEALKMWNDAYTEENEKLKAENYKLQNNLVGFDEFARNISKTRIEITDEAIPTCKTLLEYIKKEKRNAVEEFAEKLKRKAFNKDMFNDWAGATYVVLVREIDELLKEYENEKCFNQRSPEMVRENRKRRKDN